jgi:hypothetical protein
MRTRLMVIVLIAAIASLALAIAFIIVLIDEGRLTTASDDDGPARLASAAVSTGSGS